MVSQVDLSDRGQILKRLSPDVAAAAVAQVRGMAAQNRAAADGYWSIRDQILSTLSGQELELLALVGTILVDLATHGLT